MKKLFETVKAWLRSRVTAMKSEKGRWKRERLMADTGVRGLLYAVSAINRKSIIVLRRIGGHWQVKTA